MILLDDNYAFHFTGATNVTMMNLVPPVIDIHNEYMFLYYTHNGSGTDKYHYYWRHGDVGFGYCYDDIARLDGDGKGCWDERAEYG